MRYILYVFSMIFIFSSCKKLDNPQINNTLSLNNIYGKWVNISDTSDWVIIQQDFNVYYKNSFPKPLQGSNYPSTIPYYIDTTNHNVFYFFTYRAYPTLVFYIDTVLKGYMQYKDSSYLQLIKIK